MNTKLDGLMEKSSKVAVHALDRQFRWTMYMMIAVVLCILMTFMYAFTKNNLFRILESVAELMFWGTVLFGVAKYQTKVHGERRYLDGIGDALDTMKIIIREEQDKQNDTSKPVSTQSKA